MNFSTTLLTAVFFSLLTAAAPLSAQVTLQPVQPQSTPATEKEPEAPAPERVIIERDAMKLIDPKVYQVPLRLVPSKFITVVSPATGVISNFAVKPGDRLSAQAELFSLENSVQELQVQQAQAEVEAKKARLAQAKRGADADAKAIAEAELKVAELGLQIAKARLEKTIIRAEDAAEVYRTYAVPGELVTLYQKIVDIGDPNTMTVEIPVNRADVEQGGTVNIKIEDQEAAAKVVAILPAAQEFEPLRDLFDSLASARLEIDNRDKKLKAGQAVYISSIPRETVTEVANATIVSTEEGQRKVQVIRKNVVRDIPVTVLAPVGAERSYIMGQFQADDELIHKSSIPLEKFGAAQESGKVMRGAIVELADGTQLSQKVADEKGSDDGSTTGAPKNVGGF